MKGERIMKRVISMVVAATMLIGSTAFAFSDMKDTENSVLAEKLGIISGYEDGTFKPNQEVTRAEAAKIVSTALGFGEDKIDGERETEFSDMDKTHWANFYICICVAKGVISGFEDGTFRPDEKVTIEQILTMLVCALGYGEYAQKAGGYPSGYMAYAKNTGIIGDKKYSSDDANATRGNVMNFTANALHVPVVAMTGMDTTSFGEYAPVYEVMDGSNGMPLENMLYKCLDVFEVTGTVKAINKDTADIEIASSENFDGEKITKDNVKTVSVKLDDEKAVEKDKEYKMYIRCDLDTEEYSLLSAVK